MRLIALVGALAACGGSSATCSDDPDCADGELCTRNHACLPPSEVRQVHVTWTVQGMPASDTTCRGMQFELEFIAPGHYDPLRYAPVPCSVGTFLVDKLPTAFTVVRVHRGPVSQTVQIDPTTGEAAFETGQPRG